MARWALSKGIEMESLTSAPDAVTGALVVEGPGGAPVLLGDVDDVAFSEIIRDVEAVRGLLSDREEGEPPEAEGLEDALTALRQTTAQPSARSPRMAPPAPLHRDCCEVQ